VALEAPAGTSGDLGGRFLVLSHPTQTRSRQDAKDHPKPALGCFVVWVPRFRRRPAEPAGDDLRHKNANHDRTTGALKPGLALGLGTGVRIADISQMGQLNPLRLLTPLPPHAGFLVPGAIVEARLRFICGLRQETRALDGNRREGLSIRQRKCRAVSRCSDIAWLKLRAWGLEITFGFRDRPLRPLEHPSAPQRHARAVISAE
jgi:hypothetical protein